MSTTGNQRPEQEVDDGAITVRGDLPAGPEAAPVSEAEARRAARARFTATLIDPVPPVHEPSPSPSNTPPPRITEPRLSATMVDFSAPTEMQHAVEAAPQTTRKMPSRPAIDEEEAADSARAFELRSRRPMSSAFPQNAAPAPPPEQSAMEMRRAAPTLPSPAPRTKKDQRFFSRQDPARRLDRYELITEIAAGGMATVYLARLQGTGGFQRLVAIKRLHAELATEPEFVEMFLEEARIAAQIHHAHAVPILEIGSSPRGYYLVMEYIEGVTLAQLAHRVAQAGLQMPRKIALRIILDALSGLHAAHELNDEGGRPIGVVHRDVSPQNILVGVDGTARLTDFGVARTTAHVADSKLGALKGKVAYMAPEQIRREPIDRRADLFAMGVILWEVLAGRPLFRAESKLDTMERALNAPIPRLRDTVFGISDALDDLASRALSRARRERFQTAVEMADAIELVAKGSIATSREVATFTLKLFSRELNDRRTGIRTWLEEAPDTAPPPRSAPEPIVVVTLPAPTEREIEAAPRGVRNSMRITRQFVGSLAPIEFEEETIELPMSGPDRAMVRGVVIAMAILVAVVLGAIGVWKRGAGASAPGGEARPVATASAKPLGAPSSSETESKVENPRR